MRHGTCFRRRLSARHAGAAPHSAVAELGVVRRHYVFSVNRAIIFSLVVSTLPLFAAGCSSFQQTRDYYRKKHSYQATLSRITFPTTRARLYADLPPASSVRMFTASEHYRLDSEFGISMSVSYVNWFPSRGTRPITPADIDAVLLRPIRRSPKDTIRAASLTK